MLRTLLLGIVPAFVSTLCAQDAPEPPTPPPPPRAHIEGTPSVRIFKMMKGDKPAGPVTWLGVVGREVSPELYEQIDLPQGTGLVVEFVSPDSPAAKAGIKQFDVLTKFEDQILVNPQQLVTLIRNRK